MKILSKKETCWIRTKEAALGSVMTSGARIFGQVALKLASIHTPGPALNIFEAQGGRWHVLD